MAKIWFETVVFYSQEQSADGTYRSYPVASTSVQENAKNWAGEDGLREEFSNARFDHVVLTDLEMRGDGGRAYKVLLTHEGKSYEFDFREDVLMDVIRAGGIEGGGRLNGEFEFVRNGSTVRLELVGSAEHTKAKEEYAKSLKPKKREKRATIKKSELIVGRVYQKDTAYRTYEYLYVGERYVEGYTDREKKKPNKVMVFVELSGFPKSVVGDLFNWVESGGMLSFVATKALTLHTDLTDLRDLEVVDVEKLMELFISDANCRLGEIAEYWKDVIAGKDMPLTFGGRRTYDREFCTMSDSIADFDRLISEYEAGATLRESVRNEGRKVLSKTYKIPLG